MKIKQLFFLLVLLASLISQEGCKKRVENDLIGLWKLVPPSPPDTLNFWVWEFTDVSTINRVYYMNGIPEPDTSIGYNLQNGYSFSSTLNDYFIDIELRSGQIFLPAHDEEGRYRIDRVKNGILQITRVNFPDGTTKAAFLRREFVKFDPTSVKK